MQYEMRAACAAGGAPPPEAQASGRGGGGSSRPGDRVSGARARPAGGAAFVAALALLAGGGALHAQELPDVLLSLSGDDALPGGPVRDQDLVFHAAGAGSHVAWPSETFTLFTADGAQALKPVFTDVDAVDQFSIQPTAADSLHFSLGSDEAGFKDGDIIGMGPGQLFEVAIAEADFVAAVGATDGNVDVDAYQIEADGSVLFSFADNESSSFLSGDTPGQLKDGDILVWPQGGPAAQAAQVLLTEAQVDALVSAALGASTTTTDTMALARHPDTGELYFCVQSPTAHDASVFTAANGGALVAGLSETDFGFTGQPEIDALSIALRRHPALTTSAAAPAPGSSMELHLRAAKPGFPHIALVSLGVGPSQFPLHGWGGFVLTPDGMLDAALASAGSLLIVPDATGHGLLGATLPLALGPTDVVVQVISPGPDLTSTNPVLIELAQ